MVLMVSGDFSNLAYLSFRFACLTCKEYKRRVVAHRTNLYDVSIKDLLKRKSITNKVLNFNDFNNLVHMAHNRVVWGSMKNE